MLLQLFLLIFSYFLPFHLPALNDKLNDNILTYNESEDAYYIQHGADSVPKKLQGDLSGTLTITYSYNVRVEYSGDGSTYTPYTNKTVTGTITVVINNGIITEYKNSGGTGISAEVNNSAGIKFRGSATGFSIRAVKWEKNDNLINISYCR